MPLSPRHAEIRDSITSCYSTCVTKAHKVLILNFVCWPSAGPQDIKHKCMYACMLKFAVLYAVTPKVCKACILHNTAAAAVLISMLTNQIALAQGV